MLKEILAYYGDSMVFLKADGLDDAIIGVDEKAGRLIYSVNKIIDILMVRDGMSYSDAYDFLNFNIIDAYVGRRVPIWCHNDF